MTDTPCPLNVAERFNDRYTALLRSATWKRIHRTAYGNEYPEGTNTNGFYSRTTLQCCAMCCG